jgi:hypothetical protein
VSSYKLNIGRIAGVGAGMTPEAIEEAILSYPNGADEQFFRQDCRTMGNRVQGSIAVLQHASFHALERKSGGIEVAVVEKATTVPFAMFVRENRVETYAGSLKTLTDLDVFCNECGVAMAIENVELELAECLAKLTEMQLPGFRLKQVKVTDFSANSFATGSYGPKFLDTAHGQEFVEQYAAGLVGLSVAWRTGNGKVGLSMVPRSCFSFSCHEDDRDSLVAILRELAGWKKAE